MKENVLSITPVEYQSKYDVFDDGAENTPHITWGKNRKREPVRLFAKYNPKEKKYVEFISTTISELPTELLPTGIHGSTAAALMYATAPSLVSLAVNNIVNVDSDKEESSKATHRQKLISQKLSGEVSREKLARLRLLNDELNEKFPPITDEEFDVIKKEKEKLLESKRKLDLIKSKYDMK